MRYRPANSLSCVECGANRPQFASRCPCGSAHVAQALPNEDTITLDAAWAYGPMSRADDVEAMQARVRLREGRRRPWDHYVPLSQHEQAMIKLVRELPFTK